MSAVDFRLLFESAPGAYLVLDPELRVVAVTNAYLDATGIERDALLAGGLSAAPAEEAQELRASIETVLRSATTDAMRVLNRKGRQWRRVNIPVMAEGRVAYVIHAMDDITATTEKDEFIAVVSHELRTPMTSILGWTRMLALGGLDDRTYREALESVERSTLTQAKLIEDLLDESRITSGRFRLDMRAVDLRAVVASAVSSARPSAAAKQITLAFDDSGDACQISGDPSRLQQAVGNLLGNAIKFTPDGGRVTVRLFCDAPDALIEVTDSGPGIEPALLPHVFERFRQGDSSSSDRRSGLGLGLSITRYLVEMHGGSVSAESAGSGKGATFTIRLPLQADIAPSMTARDTAARVAAMPRLDHVGVLLVEDEADNRKVIAAALRHCGADVQCAATAHVAFEILSDWKPDVIISDVVLPDTDGCSFLAEVRSRGELRHIPALALTVLGRPGEQTRVVEAGFEVFRQKPIDPVDLAHDVARLARR